MSADKGRHQGTRVMAVVEHGHSGLRPEVSLLLICFEHD